MIKTKKGLLIALVVPIICLVVLTGYKKYILSVGKEVILPITGYDPRDLLSGHFLIYTVNYGVKKICKGNFSYKNKRPGYICLDSKKFSYSWPYKCELVIAGKCRGTRFEAGIERFYIPQENAKELDKLVRNKKASILLSVPINGKAQIKDLLINGTPWKDLIK